MPLASEIAAHTGSTDPAGTLGLDWSPAVLYYAHRRGNMVTAHARDAGLAAIHDDGYRYLLVALSRFARIWDSWSGGGGSALSGRTCTGSPMSEHFPGR